MSSKVNKKQAMSVHDVMVKHEGAQIILPVINEKPMSFKEAREWLQRKEEEEEQVTRVFHQLVCSPLDGAVAFQKALSAKYGWVQMVPTPGFFGSNPPVMVGVKISPTETLQVPLGRVEIPGIEGYLSTGVSADPKPVFIIGGEVKNKHAGHVAEIVKLTEKFLKEESIYRGQAIKISFAWEHNDEEYDPVEDAPHFMDLAGIRDDDLIFGEQVISALNLGLFTPIENSAACRAVGVPLKRGVLLYGPYGTGKTMTAYVAALKAVRNGWTFVYLDSVRDLKKGLEFAAQYAPCVIFAEDIDRLISGNRSVTMDDVLNTLDGVDTKGAEIITVLTTNHIEEINPAMLRPGRLDTLVEVLPPDAKAAERLVTLYSRGLLAPDVNLKRIGETLAGKIPAFIREVTERAKIAAISRLNGVPSVGEVLEDDLITSAHAMENHVNMLKPREEKNNQNAEMFVKVPSGARVTQQILELTRKSA